MSRYVRCVGVMLAGLVAVAVGFADANTPVVRAVLFSSPTCPHCNKVKQNVLPQLAARYGAQLQIAMLSTSTVPGRRLFLAACERFGIERRGVPLLVIGDVTLMGSGEIPARFPNLVAMHLARGGVDWPDIPGLGGVLAAVATPSRVMPPPQATPPPPSRATPLPAAPGRTLGPTPVPTKAAAPEPPAAPSAHPPSAADTDPAERPPSGAGGPSLIELTPDDASSGVVARLRRDPQGNGLALLVLAGMLVTLLVSLRVLRKARARRGARAATVPRYDWWSAILALAGLGVAAYLAQVEVRAVEAICGPVGDCNTVQQSEYAKLFGLLPIGVLGVLGFVAILLAWALRRWGSRRVSIWAALAILAMTGFGTLFSVYLTFLEPFVIGATCLWCLSSAVIMTTLYALALDPGRAAATALSRTGRSP